MGARARDWRKKARYAAAFLRRTLVHTNLQLLYDCNFRCQICDYWKPSRGPRPRLSAAQVSVISDKLARIAPQIVSIGGGEPLLHPEIVEVAEALGRHHFPVMICNGWFVTPELARALWAAGMYEISISVDYADAARHDRQRGTPGAYERALRALRTLHETRVHAEQRVHMISVVMDDNLEDVEPLIRIARDLGITYLLTLYSDERGCKPPRAPGEDVSAHLLALKARYPEFVVLRGYVGNFTRAIHDGGIGPCRAGQNLCNVDSQGDVSLCIDHLDEPVGNLLDEEPRAILQKLREKHRQNTCRSCWTSCRGTIETLMYGRDRVANLRDYFAMAEAVPLVPRTADFSVSQPS